MKASANNLTKPSPLSYPFDERWCPEQGQPFEVAEGVYWLRMPLPIALDHINLWILRDGDGWTIVDSGYDSPICEAVWEQVFDGFLTPSNVQRVIVTHLHPDHMGLAAWLANRCDCPVWISRGEFAQYRAMVDRDIKSFSKDLDLYLDQLELSDKHKNSVLQFFTPDKKSHDRRVQTSQCVFIQDRDSIQINNRAWQVVTGNGHSPEHACLYCPELNVFISGDQAIPRISSNVSVYPGNRSANPLNDWLASCAKLRDSISNNTIILPSHQEPFIGIVQRMQTMIDDHHAELQALRLILRTPKSLIEVRQAMFKRELNPAQTLLASGEALAHLNYLVDLGEVIVDTDDNSLEHYQLAD